MLESRERVTHCQSLVRWDHERKDLADKTAMKANLARRDNNQCGRSLVCLAEKRDSWQQPGSCKMSCERLRAEDKGLCALIKWYLNLSAMMLSSVTARKQSQLVTITSLKNGCDSRLLSTGFSAQTTRRRVRIKGTVNGAKYKQIMSTLEDF